MSRYNLTSLQKRKANNEKFTVLTAYDASFAHVLDAAGIDMILVGDSLGMVVQGKETTLPVTMDEMVYHTQAVVRGAKQAMIMADLPFMADHSVDAAVLNAARLMKEGGAQIIKLEGGLELEPIIERLAVMGVPVCAHMGLLPQSVNKLGGYKVAGRDDEAAAKMLEVAARLEACGADMLLLECVPRALAQAIADLVTIPVIGIGAGPDVDAQVLVVYDMIGITPGKRPKFSKDFMQGVDSIQAAIEAYVAQVQSGEFPQDEHCF